MVIFHQAVAEIETAHKAHFIKLIADWYQFNLNYDNDIEQASFYIFWSAKKGSTL